MTVDLREWLRALYHDLPVTRLLQLDPQRAERGALLIRQPVVAAASSPQGLHRGALLIAIDSAVGAAAQTVTAAGAVPSTIDMRVDYLSGAPLNEAVWLQAEVIGPVQRTVCTRASVYVDKARPLALAVANFAISHWPGLTSPESPPPNSLGNPRVYDSFEDLLAIQETSEGLIIQHKDDLVGAKSMPAFHGGCVAAVLDAQCERLARQWAAGQPARVLSTSLQFLRPAMATEPVRVRGQIERAGRTTAILTAEALQQRTADRPVARAICVYGLADDSSTNP